MRSWNPLPALAVAFAVSLPLIVTPAIILSTLWRLSGGGPKQRPISWGLAATYLCFMVWDQRTPSRNPRTSSWARSIGMWPNGRRFFRSTFNKHVSLRSDRTYLFSMHPHGVLCFSVWVNYLSNRNAFPELKSTRLATISSNFVTPALRDMFMSLGFIPATKEAMTYTLKHEQSTALLVGGAAEAQANSNKAHRLVLATRLGFVRVAMEADSPAVILFHLHENDTYKSPLAKTANDCDEDKGFWIPKILAVQKLFLNTFGFSAPLFLGRYGNILTPHQIRLETVSGDFPIDFRVLAEFWYFLALNQLPTGSTPQCPLGANNIPHKHVSGALDRCYCAMYSELGPDITQLNWAQIHNQNNQIEIGQNDQNDQNDQIGKNTPISQPIEDRELSGQSSEHANSQGPDKQIIERHPRISKAVIVNKPRPLTQSELYNDATFPVEYQIQQTEPVDYERILGQLPNSKKKKILLKKIQSYKIAQEKKLVQFARDYDRAHGISEANSPHVEYDNSISRPVPPAQINSTTTNPITRPKGSFSTDPRRIAYFQPSATTHEPPRDNEDLIPPRLRADVAINKPCFLEEILHIPLLSPQDRFTMVSQINDSINSSASVSSFGTGIEAVDYRSQPVTWSSIPDPVVKWLLLLYIAQLHQTYHKYNDRGHMPLELVDFNFESFCTKDCGVVWDATTIPTTLLKKYRNGIDINDYLALMGWNGGLVMGLLAQFLNLKLPATPLSLDGTSGRPYKRQPVPSSGSIESAQGLSKEAEIVVMEGKVAKL